MNFIKSYINKFQSFIFYYYILIFPMGQLLKLPVEIGSGIIDLNLADIITLFSLSVFLKYPKKLPRYYKELWNFALALILSLVLSIYLFKVPELLTGFLYLFRFINYICFSILIFNQIRLKHIGRQKIINYILVSIFFTAVLGWLQYIFVPDVRFLWYFNWDDHLYRLVGTFLDPAFTALVLLLGLIISAAIYIESKKNIYFGLGLLFFATILFTYSRATILSLIVALLYLLYKKWLIKPKIIIIGIALLILCILALPIKESEGTLLSRTRSISAKFVNYSETIELIKINPLFGIGFNNLCAAKVRLFNENEKSHACSGSDSSILFILATSGVVGLMLFVSSVNYLYKGIKDNIYGLIFKTSGVAILIHSLFVQSMFYSFILGLMALFLALSNEVTE